MFKQQDFQLQTLERKIARLEGERSNEEKNQLEEKIKVGDLIHYFLLSFIFRLTLIIFLYFSLIFFSHIKACLFVCSRRVLSCFIDINP